MAEMIEVLEDLSSEKSTISLDKLFNQVALKYPDNVAITYVDSLKQEDLSYHELSKKALQISSYLKTFCKIQGQNKIIGLYSRNIPGLIACMIGILRMPAAFAPIGLDWPAKMVKEFLETSDVNIVLVNVDFLQNFKEVLKLLEESKRTFELITECEVLSLNGFALAIAINAEKSKVSFDHDPPLAYVMQTSGTTGSPTLVKVPHICIVPNLTSLVSIFQMTPEDLVAVVSPSTFDPFFVQLFLALSSGGRAVVVSEAIILQTEKLCQILFDELKISIFQPTPSLMYLIGPERIKNKILQHHSPLRILAFGGEACPPLSILQMWKHPKCKTRIFNLYGITEVSSWASCFEVLTDKKFQDSKCEKIQDHYKDNAIGDEILSSKVLQDSVPLGIPLDDTAIEVRDESGLNIDEGVGHIFVGGGNRVCYLGNETTFKPGTMRPTGDIGYIKGHQIWYIGRKKRNVKRQGKEISLDWLEQSMSRAFPDFVFCALADDFLTGRQKKIYLFARPESSYDERFFFSSLKKKITESFPSYAQPDYVGIVDTIPLTSHGKVDTRTLLGTCGEKETLNSSKRKVEDTLEKIWLTGIREIKDGPAFSHSWTIDVGGLEEVGDTGGHVYSTDKPHKHLQPRVQSGDMFVEQGGSSIAALRVANEIEAWLHQRVGSRKDALSELVDVLLNSPFGKLCEYVKTRLSEKSYDSETTTVKPDKVDRKAEEHGPLESVETQGMAAYCSGEVPGTSTDYDSSLMFSQHFDGGNILKKKTSIFVDDKEMSPSISSKRRKTDVHLHQNKVATDLTNCFCSIQRGMRATTCPLCKTLRSGISNELHYQETSPLSNIHRSNLNKDKFCKAVISFKWKTNFHKCIDASPLVVGVNRRELSVVYLGSHAHVFKAVCLMSGTVLWETRVGDRIESSAALSKCGLYIIVGCYNGKVYVLNRHDGAVTWTFQTGGPVKSSPCVDPSTGLVWIGSHDHHLYVLDVTQGDCITSIDCGSTCFSSPWILENPHLVFIGTLGGKILCVDALINKVKWSHQCPKPVFSSPLAIAQGVVYASVDGKVCCCDLDGNPMWEFGTAGYIFSSPSFLCSSKKDCPGNIFFGSHDGFVYCISDSGKLRWKFATDSQVYSTPFVIPLRRSLKTPKAGRKGRSDHLKLDIPDTAMQRETLPSEELAHFSQSTLQGIGTESSDPVVMVCSTLGTLYCLSLDEGILVSSWSFPGQVFSSPVIVGNNVLVGCRDDFLYCLTMEQQHSSTVTVRSS